MTDQRPTRQTLKCVLDTIYLDVLDAGERRRALRRPGDAPEWVPHPQEDERFADLEPEQWDRIPTWPELEAGDWSNSVSTNRIDSVEPLVVAVMSRLGVLRPASGDEWLLFLRLALVVIARAQAMDSQREMGDYSGGFPEASPMPMSAMPNFEAASAPVPVDVIEPDAIRPPVQMSMRRRPGPKSASSHVREALERLLESGERFDSLADLSRTLEGWLRVEHPDMQRVAGTITAILAGPELVGLRDRICPPAEGVDQPHGHHRRTR